MELDPQIQTSSEDPYEVYRELRERSPLARYPGRDLWVLSRYADVQAAVRDPATWSSARGTVPSGFVPAKPMLITQDPPRHTRLRKAVQRAFTPRRVAALEPRIRAFARELIADFPDTGTLDLFEAYTNPLPIFVISELLGVDRERREMFTRAGDAIIHGQNDPDSPRLAAAQEELFGYLASVVPERRARPGDDLMSVLLHASGEGEALDEEELLGFCGLLLLAGTETTTMSLTSSLVLMDRRPEVRETLRAQPDLWPRAIEEFLRFDSPVQGQTRSLLRDVEVLGRKLREGERVHLLYASANRDERVFPDPDRFDLEREPNNHLAFGFGIHFCLGASLARLELRVALQELLARAPNYAVDHDRTRRVRSDTNRGFDRLPVSLEP